MIMRFFLSMSKILYSVKLQSPTEISKQFYPKNCKPYENHLKTFQFIPATVQNTDTPGALMINPAQTLMLVQALQKVKETAAKVGTDHRDLHSSVSKVGKAVDRAFVSDYDSTSRDDVFTSAEQQGLLNKVILQHFCRQGLLDISDVLIKEANFPLEEDPRLSKAAFQQLNEIQEAFARRDLGTQYILLMLLSKGLLKYQFKIISK